MLCHRGALPCVSWEPLSKSLMGLGKALTSPGLWELVARDSQGHFSLGFLLRWEERGRVTRTESLDGPGRNMQATGTQPPSLVPFPETRIQEAFLKETLGGTNGFPWLITVSAPPYRTQSEQPAATAPDTGRGREREGEKGQVDPSAQAILGRLCRLQ